MKIAIVGTGIVGAFAARAALDANPLAEVVMFSHNGILQMPPSAGFYIHDLPEPLNNEFQRKMHLEISTAGEGVAYFQKQWGPDYIPPFYDNFLGRERSQWVESWRPSEELMLRMVRGIQSIKKATFQRDDILALWSEFDLIIQTINVSHIADQVLQTVSFPVLMHDDFTQFRTKGGFLNPSQQTKPNLYHYAYKLGWSDALNHLWTLRELRAVEDICLYNCTGRGPWLRATLRGNEVVLELVSDFLEPRTWAHRFEEFSKERFNSAIAMEGDLRWVKKIPPTFTDRNISPHPNLLLTGRWATWDKREDSHATYYRVFSFVKERTLAASEA